MTEGSSAGRHYLSDCGSQAHRAVAGACRLALTGQLAPGVLEDVAASDAMAFAEIAQSHHIDTALAPAFAEGSPLLPTVPADLALFFREMAVANGRRNAALKRQLGEIGAAFAAASIPCLALKGAAELLDPWWPRPEARYLSDLDLLVRGDDLLRAGRVLEELGATQDALAPPEGHHHAAPHLAAHWAAMVELHVAVGPGTVARLLPAASTMAAARPSGTRGIALPAPSDRLIHLVAHAPRSGAGRRSARLCLRDLAGVWLAAAALGPRDQACVAARFAAIGETGLLERYLEAAAAAFSPAPPALSRRTRAALAAYGRPGRDRGRDALAWLAHYCRTMLTDGAARRRYWDRIRQPSRLAAVLRFHRRRHRLLR